MLHKTTPENTEATLAFPTILTVTGKIAADIVKEARKSLVKAISIGGSVWTSVLAQFHWKQGMGEFLRGGSGGLSAICFR